MSRTRGSSWKKRRGNKKEERMKSQSHRNNGRLIRPDDKSANNHHIHPCIKQTKKKRLARETNSKGSSKKGERKILGQIPRLQGRRRKSRERERSTVPVPSSRINLPFCLSTETKIPCWENSD